MWSQHQTAVRWAGGYFGNMMRQGGFVLNSNGAERGGWEWDISTYQNTNICICDVIMLAKKFKSRSSATWPAEMVGCERE